MDSNSQGATRSASGGTALAETARDRAAVPTDADVAELPTVTVVLPVRHEAGHLGSLLDQLLAQDYPAGRLDIVIADGGWDEADDAGTRLAQEYAARWPERVRWVANPGRRSSAGRNAGLAAATGVWVVFVDGHCHLPGRRWLQASMQEAGKHGALCLSRPQPLVAPRGAGMQAVIARARATRIAHGADSTIYAAQARGWVNPSSAGAAYHRCLFAWAGNYDESFDACEDVEFNFRLARAGVRAWQCPEAVVYYAARSSLRSLWLQMVRYGRGRVRLAHKHAAARRLPQYLPALWLAGLPVAVLVPVFGPGGWRWLPGAAFGLYALVVLGYAVVLGWRHGWRHLWTAPGVYVTVHAGLGAGTWREMLSLLGRRQRSENCGWRSSL